MLASTILITASGFVTCAMRRTLVSRKARKRRIAENPEMSGENFYARQSMGARADSPPPIGGDPKVPMVNGAPGANKLPAFAMYEKGSVTEEDRLPLNQRSPTSRGPPTGPSGLSDDGSVSRYGGPPQGMGRGYNGPRDEYGNPLPPAGAYPPGPGSNNGDPRLRSRPSGGSLGSQGQRGPPGYGRGRGGNYGPRGRGGPYGGPGRGPPPQGFDSGMRGPPPQQFDERGMPIGAMAAGAGAGMVAGAMAGRGRGPPPGYPPRERGPQDMYNANYAQGPPPRSTGRNPSPGPPSNPGYGRNQSPGPTSNPGYARNPSPGPPSNPGYAAYNPQLAARRSSSPPPPLPIQDSTEIPIGQAVEMDASSGQRSPVPMMAGGINEEGDVERRAPPRMDDSLPIMSPTSVYSRAPSMAE